MLASPGSFQVRTTVLWVAVADSPVGLAGGSAACPSGSGAAGMSMWEPARTRAHPVRVDRLDAVGVGRIGRHCGVGIGGRGTTRIRHQYTELAPGIVLAHPPQDDVAGDAGVAGVVPGQDHLIVGRRGREARGLGGCGGGALGRWRGCRGRPCQGPAPAGPRSGRLIHRERVVPRCSRRPTHGQVIQPRRGRGEGQGTGMVPR